MLRLVARYLLLVVAVILLNFGLPRLLPGDPLDDDPTPGLNAAGPVLTAEARRQLRSYYHLDRPWPEQLAAYLGDLSHADFGRSIGRMTPVGSLIAERLPWTLGLLLGSTAVAATGGIALGMVAAWRGGWTDRAILVASTSLAAVPEFLVAMLLILVFSVGLGWFPLQGGRQPFPAVPDNAAGWLAAVADVVWHLVLPAATLVVASSASFVLVARGASLDVRASPYLMTARAKGLTEVRVALRHALPNALLPILTLYGLRVGQVLGGAIVVERAFSIPGVGLLAFQAIGERDYPILQAMFLLSSLLVLMVNFSLELVYRAWPPRRG